MSFFPRWMHKAYADAMGYFWLPCPICGEYFGGHEWGNDTVSLALSAHEATGVCNNPKCSEEAARRNVENGFASWNPPYVGATTPIIARTE